MLSGPDITSLMDLLSDKGIGLFHACQLTDFRSYLELGGIPSRNLMKNRGKDFTKFETDTNDQNNAVFDKVFLNLDDFGKWYHWGKNNLPNPYGPILIKVEPTASLYMTDLCLTLRSAGARDFNRGKESINSIDDIEKIFKKCNGRYFVKFESELKKEFPNRKIKSPEINCSFPGELLSIDHFSEILVDPVYLEGNELHERVKSLCKRYYTNLDVILKQRYSKRPDEFDELVKIAYTGITEIPKILDLELSDEFENWITEVDRANLGWLLDRYLKYLKIGTLSQLRKAFSAAS